MKRVVGSSFASSKLGHPSFLINMRLHGLRMQTAWTIGASCSGRSETCARVCVCVRAYPGRTCMQTYAYRRSRCKKCVHKSIHMCMYKFTYTWLHTYIYMVVYIYIYLQLCIHTYIHERKHVLSCLISLILGKEGCLPFSLGSLLSRCHLLNIMPFD